VKRIGGKAGSKIVTRDAGRENRYKPGRGPALYIAFQMGCCTSKPTS
jgi:hypothetical protein